MTKLIAIALTERRMAPMVLQNEADLSIEAGIAGDARGTEKLRQVSVLFEGDWKEACAEIGQELPWTTRRANFLVNGENPKRLGARLEIGDVILEVTEETEPCALMERAARGLRGALKPGWRGGVCCRVIQGGHVAVGNELDIQLPQ